MELQNSNRIIKKYWNSNNDYFLFEEHCFGTHFSTNSIVEEDEVRKSLWRIFKGDIVIDAGASYGNYTLPALAAGARVYAFEINEWLSKSLSNNIVLNNFHDCTIESKALWNKTGEKIKYYEDNLSLFSFGAVETGKIREVETITVDDYFIPLSIPKINWFKIDVDGAELHVLEGALMTLKRYKPKLLIELHPILEHDLPNKITNFIGKNFQQFSVDGPYAMIANHGETSHVLVSIA